MRLVDLENGISGLPYISNNRLAYIAFDGLRLHESRPSFPNELDPAEIQILPPLDYIPHAGLSGEDAAAAMTVPDWKVLRAGSSGTIWFPPRSSTNPIGS